MPTDYDRIRQENRQKYGTDIGRIGRMLMSGLYADRTHFIFELLQNAEDALANRGMSEGERAVEIDLSNDALTFTHFGKPFDEADVHGVCGIGESSKELTDIGKFGIGFKAVYAFTDSPEIHSGREHFAIDSYVRPRAIPEIGLPPGRTVIRLPFSGDSQVAVAEIQEGLQKLDLGTLLFLREIEEISWSVPGGQSGLLRRQSETLNESVRKVTLIGQNHASKHTEEKRWLVFSREVSNEGTDVGRVELAFALMGNTGGEDLSVQPINYSPLVVFFPTVLSTNLGFLMQGPFRTTPSRDNVPARDAWNHHLVRETSVLLVDALRELRELGLLNVSALQSLPLNGSLFPEGSMFSPPFLAVREALETEPLLPRYKGGYVAAQRAKLARSQDLRDLISPEQLAGLFQSDHELAWLSGDITADRAPDIHNYLVEELEVEEVTPEWLISRLTREFLETQSDEWTGRLYAFLNSQKSLLWRLRKVPLVRLQDGTHVVADCEGQPQAYLPDNEPTGFPTVRASVCESEDALTFLKSLGLRPADPVDDVITNILPNYCNECPEVTEAVYESDIERILAAFETDSNEQQRRLVSRLKSAWFVRAMDAGNSSLRFARPGDTYLATRRMKELFAGVRGVLIVDDSVEHLGGKRVRALLEAVGVAPKLTPIQKVKKVSWRTQEMKELRENHRRGGGSDIGTVHSYEIRGLKPLLKAIANLPCDEAVIKSALLWKVLCGVNPKMFRNEYRWHHYNKEHGAQLKGDAELVQLLNETAWVADESGALKRPDDVVFESTKWEPNLALQDKIRFKKPVVSAIDRLARKSGVEADLLPLLIRHGVTSVEQFNALLHQAGRIGKGDGAHDTLGYEYSPHSLSDEAPRPNSIVAERNEPTYGSAPDGAATVVGSGKLIDRPIGHGAADPAAPAEVTSSRSQNGSSPHRTKKGMHSGKRQKFNSYVPVNPDDQQEGDSDGFNHQERLELEEHAIKFVRAREPGLEFTPKNNPGFDLLERGADGQPTKWVEVKAMKGTLRDRPITVSRTQFEYAQKHGENYWLYIVENAGDTEQARVFGIQDPYGKTRTLTFDSSWVIVAEDMEAIWEFCDQSESREQAAQIHVAESNSV